MKTAVKRTISALLAVILLLSAAPLLGVPFKASATSRTKDEAINWVKGKVGQGLDMDGAYGCQCVDLILAYYDYLGVSRSSGNGEDYAWNTLPSGWQRLQGAQPQKGDILVYSGNDSNPYGHVAIYESDYLTYHQNFDGKSYVTQVTYCKYNGINNPYWGVIRPNWSDHTHTYNASATISKAPTQTETGTRVRTCSCGETKTQTIPAIPYTTDLADGVYAIETKVQSGALISNNGGGTVYIYTGTASDQRWFFRKNSDGTYCLENYAYRGNYMTVENSSMVHQNFVVAQYTGGNNQRFYVIPEGNYYRLVVKHSYMTVDLSDANPENGTYIQQYEDNGSNAQRWVLKNCTPTLTLSASSVTVSEGGAQAVNCTIDPAYECLLTPSISDEDVCSVSWGSWDGWTRPLIITGKEAGGTATITITFKDKNSDIVYATKTINVTVPDPSKPNAEITSYTKNVAPSQTVTLTLSDDEALAGYYWGTSSTYENNPFTPLSGTSQTVTETVSAPGTYYLTAKDAKGKVSSTVSKKFYQTTLDAAGGSVSPESVLLAYTSILWTSTSKFNLPEPTRSGHIFQNWNTKADGSGTAYAAGESFKVTGNSTLYAQWEPAPHVHEYTSAVTQEPTCTEEGVMTYTCECGDSYTEPIEKAPHTLSDWIVLRQPSCTVTGLRVKMCTVCLQTIESETIPALDHSYGEWTVITAPTCTEPGEGSHTCANCGAEETAAIPALGHDYTETVTPPTCTEDGFTTHVCSRCGDTYTTDVVSATGHTYSEWMMFVDPTLTADGVMGRKCTVCGTVLDEVTVPRLAGDHVTGVALSAARVYMNRGEMLTLTAAVTPDTAHNKALAWSSSHPETATVTNGAVAAVAPGLAVIIAQAEDSGHKDFCVVQVNAVTPQNGAVIENGTITGLRANLNSLEDYLNLLDESMTIETNGTIGTGTKVYIMQGDTVVNEFETVLFGDVNGDGWYDGTDAYLVSLVAMGMIPQTALTEAQRAAADCNHDGTVDNADVALLEQAGLLLANVDQTLPSEELQTDSVYLEYCSLIDQNVEIIEPEQPAAEQPAQTAEQPAVQSVWGWIKALFTIVLNWLLRVF